VLVEVDGERTVGGPHRLEGPELGREVAQCRHEDEDRHVRQPRRHRELFGVVVAEERGAADAGTFDDLLDGGGGDALGARQVGGSRRDPSAGLVALSRPEAAGIVDGRR
jgi:hypothetical protein